MGKKNWDDIIFESDSGALREIDHLLDQGDVEEAQEGVKHLLTAMSIRDKRALKSQLERLMLHIIKWESQPEKRSVSWVRGIYQARDEIENLQEDIPSFTDDTIRSFWDYCFNKAHRGAIREMRKKKSVVESLSWEDVFEKEYSL